MPEQKPNIVTLDRLIEMICYSPPEHQLLFITHVQENPKNVDFLDNTLKELISLVTKDPKGDIYRWDIIYILLNILAYCESKTTFSSLLSLSSLDVSILEKNFGEFCIIEIFSLFMPHYINDLEPLKKIIEDPNIADDWKGSAILSCLELVALQKVSRQEVIEYLKKMLKKIVDDYDHSYPFTDEIISILSELNAFEAEEEIREAYGRFLVFDEEFPIDEFNKALKISPEIGLKNLISTAFTKEEILKDLRLYEKVLDDEKASSEDTPVPKRPSFIQPLDQNALCTCKSQKKYKKCCGATAPNNPLQALIPSISFEPEEDLHTFEPEDQETLFQLSEPGLVERDQEKALRILKYLIVKYPNFPLLHFLIQDVYLTQNNLKEYVQSLHQAIQLFPNDLNCKLLYADYLLRRGEFVKIEILFDGKFTLQELYPEKTTFSLYDFKHFSLLMGTYFAKIKKIQQADLYLRAVKQFINDDESIKELDQLIDFEYQKSIGN
ncbi:MAG: DUF1186 domain-containing protein [Chlamydiae bacterium]|nr:DUF1186 domain-containing protein [Chlamydiota bacterium]